MPFQNLQCFPNYLYVTTTDSMCLVGDVFVICSRHYHTHNCSTLPLLSNGHGFLAEVWIRFSSR